MSKPLKPISGQDGLNELCEYFLGEDWYVADPLGPTQVNAIIVDEIKKRYPKNPKCHYHTSIIDKLRSLFRQ